jgi:hypothetical protein
MQKSYVQGCEACIAVMRTLRNLHASPRVIKHILEAAPVDLRRTLSPANIAELELYRDECIRDCGLAGQTSAPQYQSLYNGLALDDPIMRFNKVELETATMKVLAEALVVLAYAQALSGDVLAPPEARKLIQEQARKTAKLGRGRDPTREVSDQDFLTWILLIYTAGEGAKYRDFAETAGTIAGFLPFGEAGYSKEWFARAITEARKIVKAQGPRGDMRWVLGFSDDPAAVLDQEADSLELELPSSKIGLAGSEEVLEAKNRLMQRFDGGISIDNVQEERADVEDAGDQEKKVPDEGQANRGSELTNDNRLEGTGEEAVDSGEAKALGDSVEGIKEQLEEDEPRGSGLASSPDDSERGGAKNMLQVGQGMRSWAGLIQYFVDLTTDRADDKEGYGQVPDVVETEQLGKGGSSLEGARTWVGLLNYLWELLKKWVTLEG